MRVEGMTMARPALLVSAAVLVLGLQIASARADGGTITGTVRWKGPVPARTALDRSSDPTCAATPRQSEDVVVTDGKVAGVLVRIKIGTAGVHEPPTTPAVLVQDQCMYGPRVVGVMAGQSLEIRNGDPTFHNVRGNRAGKVTFNLAQPQGAAPLVRKDLGRPGDVIDLHCDVHPWMAGWIVVLDHPYFAVTGTDGAFTLRDVPPGTYALETWHPVLGLRTTKIKVRKGKVTKATFTLELPSLSPTTLVPTAPSR